MGFCQGVWELSRQFRTKRHISCIGQGGTMYCPSCSQEKESKGVGLCGECYQFLKKKLENLSKRHADLFENSLSMQAKFKVTTAGLRERMVKIIEEHPLTSEYETDARDVWPARWAALDKEE